MSDLHTVAEPLSLVIVENHESTLTGIVDLCSRHPEEFTVLGAYSDLAELDLSGPAPDVVILDLLLGRDDVSSAPAIPRLRAWGAKVLLHTSEEKPVALRQAMSAGASGMALKNDGNDALLGALLTLRTSDFAVSSVLAQALLEDPLLIAQLTAREVEVLQAVDDGLSKKQIASRLGISPATVKTHIDNACEKYRQLGREVTNTVSAVRLAREEGWLGR